MNVQVRQTTTGKGKGLFALGRLDPGCRILTEEPLVSCQFSWNAAYGYAACDHCMRPLETAEENASRLAGTRVVLPYPECCETDKTKFAACGSCGAKYCSEQCREIATKRYHACICHPTASDHPLEKLNEAWKKCHYPPETNTVMLIIRLLARIVQSQDKELAVGETLQFCHRTVNEESDLAHKLLGERFASQLDSLYGLYVEAAPKDEAVARFLTPEGFRSMLALIGTNAQGVGTSPLSVWSTNAAALPLDPPARASLDAFTDALYDQIDERSGDFLDNDGVALYPLQSACNHSCSPNARVTFEHGDHRLTLVAVETIRAGEEITISYLDECTTNRSRHSRRKELKANYLFECECRKCMEEDGGSDKTSSSSSNEDDENEPMIE